MRRGTSIPIGDEGRGVGSAWADFDNDGDPDVYLSRWGSANRLYRNDQVTGNHWLQVDLLGSLSSRAGVGARMRAMLKENGPPPNGRWVDLENLEPVRNFKARHASTLLVFDAVEDAIGQIEGRRSPGGEPDASKPAAE